MAVAVVAVVQVMHAEGVLAARGGSPGPEPVPSPLWDQTHGSSNMEVRDGLHSIWPKLVTRITTDLNIH